MKQRPGSALEVLAAFTRLGLTSFGGPAAHLGYFRLEFVRRRRWLDDAAYADLIALCQFLPGPSSSQAGFAIGLLRAGPLGALAAFVGFTFPSAVIMLALGLSAGALSAPWAGAVIHGLKLAAVAAVASAVWGMARSLAAGPLKAGLAIAALAVVALVSGGLGQMIALAIGAAAGALWLKPAAAAASGAAFGVSQRVGAVCLALFAALLVGLPVAAHGLGAQAVAAMAAFYRAGALVFGGGHVVLPLLQADVVRPGWVDPSTFLAGYAAAQALPGPLFTFAAYLGTLLKPGPNGLAGGLLALAAIFAPGFLILLGALPLWSRLKALPRAQGAVQGAGAAVVGVLGTALYNPVWTQAVLTPVDAVIAIAGFAALTFWRTPPALVVVLGALIGLAGG